MDVDQPVSQCWCVGRQRGVVLVDVNDRDSASRASLRALGSHGTAVLPRGSSCRRSRDSLIFLQPVEDETGAWRGGRSPRVRASTNAKLWAEWKTVCSLTQSWFTVPRWRRRRPHSLRRRDVESLVLGGSQRTRNFAAEEESDTRTSLKHLTQPWSRL